MTCIHRVFVIKKLIAFSIRKITETPWTSTEAKGRGEWGRQKMVAISPRSSTRPTDRYRWRTTRQTFELTAPDKTRPVWLDAIRYLQEEGFVVSNSHLSAGRWVFDRSLLKLIVFCWWWPFDPWLAWKRMIFYGSVECLLVGAVFWDQIYCQKEKITT